MVEQARAQIVDHPLDNRNRQVICGDIQQTQQCVEDHEADACREQQLPAGQRRNPAARDGHPAEHVVDHNLEWPWLQYFGRGRQQHCENRNREAAKMRAHSAHDVTVKFEGAHQAFASDSRMTVIPRLPAASTAPLCTIAEMRAALMNANAPAAIAAASIVTIPATSENPAASRINKAIA